MRLGHLIVGGLAVSAVGPGAMLAMQVLIGRQLGPDGAIPIWGVTGAASVTLACVDPISLAQFLLVECRLGLLRRRPV